LCQFCFNLYNINSYSVLEILGVESNKVIVDIVVEGINNSSKNFYSPFSIQWELSPSKDGCRFSVHYSDQFKFLGPFKIP
jgi:hypothetical protein